MMEKTTWKILCVMKFVLAFVVLCGLVLGVLPGLAWAGGLYMNEFGTTSMGGAGAGAQAVANDASAIFWNPAGISNLESGDIFLGYTSWPAEINLYSTAIVAKTGFGYIGGSFTILNTGLMNRTDPYDNDGDILGTFAYEDWAAGLTFSRYLTDKFAFGTTFKLIREKLADWDATGWAVDFGTYYDTGFESLRIGMAIMNFGPDMRFDVEDVDGVAGGVVGRIDGCEGGVV